MSEYLSLMLPRPIDIEDCVLAEMRKTVVDHYGEEYVAYYNDYIHL